MPGTKHVWKTAGLANSHQANPIHVGRGRVVGGGSAINGAIFLRGMPEDYDGWAAAGNTEWSFAKVLPFFKKMETDLTFKDDFHGLDGPIPVFHANPTPWMPFQMAFLQAWLSAGFPRIADMNASGSSGIGILPTNTRGDIRVSTAAAYLNPARKRRNLKVMAGVMTTRILLRGNRARAIEVEAAGHKSLIEAEDEIVLSCGTLGSPQLLMLSGIGPEDHLKRLGIRTTESLPGVGQNFRDHAGVRIELRARKGVPSDRLLPLLGVRHTSRKSKVRNDLAMTVPSATVVPKGRRVPTTGEPLLIGCRLEAPKGAGEVRLSSKDPNHEPVVDAHLLSDEADLDRMREAVRLGLELVGHQSFQPIVESLVAPGPKISSSDAKLDEWILKSVTHGLHMAGTCKMGPSSDASAVVDQHCRVHGVEGLRVVDASVMPNVIRANTNATTIMIAERVSSMMR